MIILLVWAAQAQTRQLALRWMALIITAAFITTASCAVSGIDESSRPPNASRPLA